MLFLLGKRIINTFSGIMDYMNTHGVYIPSFSFEDGISTSFYSITDIMIGVGLPILLIAVITKWVIDIFT